MQIHPAVCMEGQLLLNFHKIAHVGTLNKCAKSCWWIKRTSWYMLLQFSSMCPNLLFLWKSNECWPSMSMIDLHYNFQSYAYTHFCLFVKLYSWRVCVYPLSFVLSIFCVLWYYSTLLCLNIGDTGCVFWRVHIEIAICCIFNIQTHVWHKACSNLHIT